MQTLTLIVPMIAVMYFVMIRPQQKQAKEHTKFLNELVKGAEIVTQGGVIGTVVQVEDRTVTVDVGGGTKLRVLKANVVGAWQEKPVAAPAKQEKK
jgi:preprotein translocase subunit YajC